ncbi:hypothetical protein ScPMuIL_012065 [Solemya velum]
MDVNQEISSRLVDCDGAWGVEESTNVVEKQPSAQPRYSFKGHKENTTDRNIPPTEEGQTVSDSCAVKSVSACGDVCKTNFSLRKGWENVKKILKKQEKLNVGGIPNLGATCYANTVFQVLAQTPGLLVHLKEVKRDKRAPKVGIVERLLPVLTDVMSKSEVNPKTVHSLMEYVREKDDSFKSGYQNDCHSFLLSLINILEEELLAGSASLMKLFEGKQRNLFEYTTCHHREISDDQLFRSILIPVSEDIREDWSMSDRLVNLFLPEVYENNMVPCRTCEQSFEDWDLSDEKKRHISETETFKRTQITECPHILILHIARFKEVEIRGSNYMELKKIEGNIPYEQYLELPDFHVESVPKVNCMYKLYGVISHSGTLSGGHYYAM